MLTFYYFPCCVVCKSAGGGISIFLNRSNELSSHFVYPPFSSSSGFPHSWRFAFVCFFSGILYFHSCGIVGIMTVIQVTSHWGGFVGADCEPGILRRLRTGAKNRNDLLFSSRTTSDPFTGGNKNSAACDRSHDLSICGEKEKKRRRWRRLRGLRAFTAVFSDWKMMM